MLKAKAPVEEVTTPEDEEKIKEDLFLRPSPSPTDLGNFEKSIINFCLKVALCSDGISTVTNCQYNCKERRGLSVFGEEILHRR